MVKETKGATKADGQAHTPYTPTADQVSAWKKQGKDPFMVTVKDASGNVHAAVFKKPGRKELSLAMHSGKDNPMKFNDSLFTNCWLEGDEIIKTDDDLYLAACGQLSTMVEVREAEIVKL